MQIARYLIDLGLSRLDDMEFNEYGQLIKYGLGEDELMDVVLSGELFMTSGCPGCNRPYANERPNEVPRNYPYPPSRRESLNAYRQSLRYQRPPRNTLDRLKRYLRARGYG